MVDKLPGRIRSAELEAGLLLFINAMGFGEATKILHAHPGNQSILLFPTLANEAFALELYLKCLLTIRAKSKIHGHNISLLFDKLDQADRDTISTYLLDFARGHPDYLLYHSKGVQFDAASVAKRARTTFARSRYWSELILPDADDNGYVGNMGVGSLIDAIVTLILELRPHWPEQIKTFGLRLPRRGLLPT